MFGPKKSIQITDKFRALIIEHVIFTARKEWD